MKMLLVPFLLALVIFIFGGCSNEKALSSPTLSPVNNKNGKLSSFPSSASTPSSELERFPKLDDEEWEFPSYLTTRSSYSDEIPNPEMVDNPVSFSISARPPASDSTRISLQTWTDLGGPRLLSRAEFSYGAVDELIGISTNLAVGTEKDFADLSGLTRVCNDNSAHISARIHSLHDQMKPTGFARYFDHSRVDFGGFPTLDKYCPAVFDADLSRIALLFRVALHWRAFPQYPVGQIFNQVDRSMAFTDCMAGLLGSASELVVQDTVKFKNEDGVGAGAFVDWFAAVSDKVFDDNGGFFASKTNDAVYKTFQDGWEIPGEFKAIGRFVAFSILREIPLGVVLPVHYWAFVLEQKLEFTDMQFDEPVLFRSYNAVMNLKEEEDVDNLYLEFNHHGQTVPLTLTNRNAYLENWLDSLISPADAIKLNKFKEGFLDLIPLNLIKGHITPHLLQSIVAGEQDFDVNDLQRNVEYMGYSADSNVIVWMFELLRSWDNEMRFKFLRFVTARERVPFGGFKNLNPRLTFVATYYGDTLPKTHTCFNKIDLPDYSSKEVMRDKLELALSSHMEMNQV